MCPHEAKKNTGATTDADIRQKNQDDLDYHLARIEFLTEDINTCFETGLGLLRCAQLASITGDLDEENAGAISQVISLAEDVFHVAYSRHMLRK